jgi:hypothetical protein
MCWYIQMEIWPVPFQEQMQNSHWIHTKKGLGNPTKWKLGKWEIVWKHDARRAKFKERREISHVDIE